MGFVLAEIDIGTLRKDVDALRSDGDNKENDEYGFYASLPSCMGFGGKAEDGKYRKSYRHRKFWLTYSSRLKEQPVNLVVPRTTLEAFQHSVHFIVTKDGVQRMKKG